MALLNRLVPWIVGALVLTMVLAAVYVCAQQMERLGADDAGDRLASAVAADLDDGKTAAAGPKIDISRTTAPFYVVYDESGAPTSGSGYLDETLATVPRGVVDTAFRTGSNHVTWETDEGLRFATVEVRAGDSVVMAAQGLGPVEARIDTIGMLLALAWACGIVVLAVGAFVHVHLTRAFR